MDDEVLAVGREVGGEGVDEREEVGIYGEDGGVGVLRWVGEEVGRAEGAVEHVDYAEADVEVEG